MKVVNHRLANDDGTQVDFRRSPNQRGTIVPEYLVIHYTGGSSAGSSVEWLTKKEAGASAHLVIGRDGSITQLVAFNKRAWHAGESRWAGRQDLNSFSIGIELDNPGKLMRNAEGWMTQWEAPVAPRHVVEAVHKNGGDLCGWHSYSQAQLEALREAAICLFAKYGLKDVVGHDDIAPGRKTDPGPAFPMASLRAAVVGRAQESIDVYRTTTTLNVRAGPSIDDAKLEFGPLPPGTQLEVIGEHGVWRQVDILDEIDGDTHRTGWVHGHYIAPA